jgi:DNA-binding NarL/FixJ family response regulator
MTLKPRRLLVVEDELLMATLLQKSLIDANFEVEIAHDVSAAHRFIERFDPDILLVDVSLGAGPSGIHLAHVIRQTRPDIAILILTKYPHAGAAAEAGLDIPQGVGFLRKHLVNDVEYLLEAIERVLADRPEAVGAFQEEGNSLSRMNPQAVKVWALLAQGYNNTEIAVQMNLSIKSVERWIETIYRELKITPKGKINPRVEAARQYYLLAGISQRRLAP